MRKCHWIKTPLLVAAASLLCAAGCVSPAATSRIKYIAHRGDYHDAPEGSMTAYRNAVARGSEIVKLDVHLSKDGVIVLSHDPSFKRTMGWDVKISDVTWDEIGHHVYLMDGKPTTEHAVSLPEALKVVGSIPEFWIDFKYFTPPFAEKVLAAFTAAGIPEDRLMVATYSQPALRYMKEHHPSIRRIGHMDFMQVKGRWSPSFARSKGVTYAPAGKGELLAREVVDGIRGYASKMDLWGVNIGQNPKLVTKELVAALKAKGLWVSIALIHTKSLAKHYVGFENDAVVTRDRLAVKSVLEKEQK